MPQARKRAAPSSDDTSRVKSARTYRKKGRKAKLGKNRYDLQMPQTYGEAKSIEASLSGKVFNTTGSVTHINAIPLGNGDEEREGKTCKVTSIQIKGYAVADTSTVGNVCRYLVIYDKKPSGTLPTPSDLLNTVSCNGFVRWDQKHRFIVLRDEAFTLAGSYTAPGTGDIVNPIHYVNEYIRLPADMSCQWTSSDTTGTIATATEGAIYLVTVGSASPTGDVDCQMACNYRVSFRDC